MASAPSSREQDLVPVVSTHLRTLDDHCSASGSGSDAARLIFARYEPEANRVRVLCREFNPSTGVYRVSVDGHFLIRASLLAHAAAPARIRSRIAVIVSHACGDSERAEQLPSGGALALLLHLRTGDCVSVQLLPSPASVNDPLATASESPSAEPAEPTTARFSVELAMRKRKRESSSDEDESERSAARAPQTARFTAGGGAGSDTDWSEGFSSDDSAHLAALPPASVRRITRRLNESLPGGSLIGER